MVFDHMVQHNNVYYEPGEDVPIKENTAVSDDVQKPLFNGKDYSRSEINLMNKADLQELANSVGIEDVYDKTGSELKKILINHFNI